MVYSLSDINTMNKAVGTQFSRFGWVARRSPVVDEDDLLQQMRLKVLELLAGRMKDKEEALQVHACKAEAQKGAIEALAMADRRSKSYYRRDVEQTSAETLVERAPHPVYERRPETLVYLREVLNRLKPGELERLTEPGDRKNRHVRCVIRTRLEKELC